MARQGYAPGGFPPVGYRAERVAIGQKRNGEPRQVARWVPDPETWERVQLAWKMRAEGATLTEVRRATGLYKSIGSYTSFFRNKTYLGVRKCGDIEVPDAHPAACTPEQWEAVQAARRARERGGAYPRRVRSPFLLSGLAVCGYCGGAVSGSHDNVSPSSGRRRAWRYYICARKKRHGWDSCPEAGKISAQRVEAAVLDAVLGQILTPERVRDLVDLVNRELITGQGDLLAQINTARRRLADVDRALGNLLELAEMFGATSAGPRILEREAERDRLRGELQALEQRIQHLEVDEDVIRAALGQMRDAVQGSTKAAQQVLRSFVNEIAIWRDHGEIRYRIPYPVTGIQAMPPRDLERTPCRHFGRAAA